MWTIGNQIATTHGLFKSDHRHRWPEKTAPSYHTKGFLPIIGGPEALSLERLGRNFLADPHRTHPVGPTALGFNVTLPPVVHAIRRNPPSQCCRSTFSPRPSFNRPGNAPEASHT